MDTGRDTKKLEVATGRAGTRGLCRTRSHRLPEIIRRIEERTDEALRWCEHCYKNLIGGSWGRRDRLDKRYCSKACRQAAYRERQPIDWSGFNVEKFAAHVAKLRERQSAAEN